MSNETVLMLEEKIAEEKKHREALWQTLGQRLDQEFAEVVKTYAPDLASQLEASQAKLAEYQEAIYEAQGLIACPHCHTHNTSDSVFCIHCGSLLKQPQSDTGERVCPHCGAPVAQDHLFCSRCGTRIDEVSETGSEAPVIPEEPVHEPSAEMSDLPDWLSETSRDEPVMEKTEPETHWEGPGYDDMTTLLVDESMMSEQEVLRCPICGEPVEPGQSFCIHCGSRIDDAPVELEITSEPQTAVCPVCGQPVKEDDQFCMNCGAKLEPQAKQVTVEADPLVCPVCGSAVKEDQVFCINCGAKLK